MAAHIALIAHDNKKDALVNFVQQHKSLFSRYDLIATGQTGELVRNKTGLAVDTVFSGPLGGGHPNCHPNHRWDHCCRHFFD